MPVVFILNRSEKFVIYFISLNLSFAIRQINKII